MDNYGSKWGDSGSLVLGEGGACCLGQTASRDDGEHRSHWIVLCHTSELDEWQHLESETDKEITLKGGHAANSIE